MHIQDCIPIARQQGASLRRIRQRLDSLVGVAHQTAPYSIWVNRGVGKIAAVVMHVVGRRISDNAFFDLINNLCAQTENLTGAETVIEVVRKNLLLSYQEQMPVAEALTDLGSSSTTRWD